jgi:hypothetical protein
MTVDDGLRLYTNSPCIDAADGYAAPLTDILGLERNDINDVNNTGTGNPDYADMGAYEYANVYNVTKGKRYSSIQPAIDDADDGDTILVSEGTYYENIDFKGKAITLTSADPCDPNVVAGTVIDAGASGDVVTFNTSEEADSLITGFTLTNGSRGIYCDETSPTITYCKIINNTSHGVEFSGSSWATITNCIIGDNSSYGIKDVNSSTVIRNCTIVGHNGGSGYGISGEDAQIKNCILWDNDYDLSIGCSATYSCVKDDPGVGNIDSDPLFVDYNNSDFYLVGGPNWPWSPCIDAGDPCSDYSNEPNGGGGKINMGVYGNTEYAATVTIIDSDEDGIPDQWELYYWPGTDPNQHDPNDDPDIDGFSNWVEYLFGYDPNQTTTQNMELIAEIPKTQIDPTKSDTVTVSYIVNMAADVNVDFVNAQTSQVVRRISQTAAAGEAKEAVWDGIGDDDGKIVERYFYDVNISASDGSNSANVISPDGGGTPSHALMGAELDTNDFNPYKNIPVTISWEMSDWNIQKIDIVEDRHGTTYFYAYEDLRIYYLLNNRLLKPGLNTLYWYGRWGDDINDISDSNNLGQICEEKFRLWPPYSSGVNKGSVLVYYDEVLSNLRCNPYLILPLNAEVTTLTYDLACDANVTVDTYDPDGNYFGTLSKQETAGQQREFIWYGMTKDANDPNSRYISTEGVYRIEVKCDKWKATENLEGSITVYRYK